MTDGPPRSARESEAERPGHESDRGSATGGSGARDTGSGDPGAGSARADAGAEPRDTETGLDPAEVVEGGPILLFDGVCNLCNGSIRFLIRRDPEGQFRFAPLQSPIGRALLEYADVDIGPVEGFVMIDGDEAYVKSEAILRVGARLGLPWSLARPLLYVPTAVRDAVYDFVATHRYRVFGKKDRCTVPDEDVSDRFLDG